MEPLLVNPPAAELGRVNAILTGRSRRYYVSEFPGPLSVKSVVAGEAVWTTGRTRHQIRPGAALVINDGQPYSIEIDSEIPVETFCVFFRTGFVEDAARISRKTADSLLDDPWKSEPVEFTAHGAVAQVLRATRDDPEPGVFALAEALAGLRRVPAAKAATRDELLERVLRGRDYMEGNLTRPLRLTETARAAFLSPFHFHRTFSAVFGEAPHQYVRRRRLETALTILQRSDESVTAVAIACGFDTASGFTTAFRKRYGTAPSEIRKNGKALTPLYARG